MQAALLEAMQERQVTIGDTTFPFEEPFLVLATQNPIEQEGTYPLPEAQLDRFLLRVDVPSPSAEGIVHILEASQRQFSDPEPVRTGQEVLELQAGTASIAASSASVASPLPLKASWRSLRRCSRRCSSATRARRWDRPCGRWSGSASEASNSMAGS